MVSKDPKIDAYISASAEFAQPILHHLRKLVYKYCPETKETMKWSFPHFTYNDSILCGMASFKQHRRKNKKLEICKMIRPSFL